MNKRSLIVCCAVIGLFIAARAQTNPYMPTFLEMITSPRGERPYNGMYMVFAAPLWLPVLLILGFVEALVIRRYVQGKSLLRLTGSLFIINFITSIVGFFSLPPNIAWQVALVIAFMQAVVLEGILLWAMAPLNTKSIPLNFAASLRINATSYAIIGIALLLMVIVPWIGTESESVLDDISGTIILEKQGMIDLNQKPYILQKDPGVMANGKWLAGVRPDGTSYSIVTHHDDIELVRVSDGKVLRSVDVSDKVSEIEGLSRDGRLVVCNYERSRVVFDLNRKKPVYTFAERSQAYYGTFSHDNKYVVTYGSTGNWVVDLHKKSIRQIESVPGRMPPVAFSPTAARVLFNHTRADCIIIYDCTKNSAKRIKIRGMNQALAWSPDGKYILGWSKHPSPVMIDREHVNIRVVSVDTQRTATVYSKLPEEGNRVVWMR